MSGGSRFGVGRVKSVHASFTPENFGVGSTFRMLTPGERRGERLLDRWFDKKSANMNNKRPLTI